MTSPTSDPTPDLGHIVCLPPLTRNENGSVCWPDWTCALVEAMQDHGASDVTIVDYLLWEVGIIIGDIIEQPSSCTPTARAKLLKLITEFSSICSELVVEPTLGRKLGAH